MMRVIPDHLLADMGSAAQIFAAPAFRALIAREFRLEPVHIQLQAKGQALSVPAFQRSPLFGGKTMVLGAGFDKTGLIPSLAEENYSQIISQLAHELPALGFGHLEVRTPQAIPCLHDGSDKVELGIEIDTSVAALWDGLSCNTRKNIRRPLKRGFTSVVGNAPQLLDEFYHLYRMSLHDLGSLPHSQQFFTGLFAQCGGQLSVFVGYMDGVPVVASINFEDQTEVYGAWAGIHTDYKKHNVFLAMLWKMVEYCGETGRKTYNLGRSSEGSNPHQFKLKLANRSHKIYYYRLRLAPPQTSTSVVRSAASWLIRHTPPLVMDSLSRALIHKFY